MENLQEKLKELGYDITTIIDGVSNPIVKKRWRRCPLYQDVELPNWTEEDTVKFSNWVYKVVTKNK